MKPKIVIVAGGLGTRIKSITKDKIPKCMLDIKGKPLIQHQLNFFKKKGFRNFVFCIGYLGKVIKTYFGNGKKFGVNIEYSEEPLKMGTAGAVKLIEKKIDDSCIVMYGDLLTSLDLNKVIEFHKWMDSDFIVVVRKMAKGYKPSSIVKVKNNRIVSFTEHPSEDEIEWGEGYINNGIYIMNKNIFQYIPKNQKYDFAKDLIPDLINKKIPIYAFVSDDFFVELGRSEKYEKFKKEVKGKSNIFRS